MNMERNDKAIKWYKEKGITAFNEDGDVVVNVNDIEIYTSTAEGDYRAGIWDEEQRSILNLKDEVQNLSSENMMFTEFLVSSGFSNEDINHIANGNTGWVSQEYSIKILNKTIKGLKDNNNSLASELGYVVEHLRETSMDWDDIEKIKKGDYDVIGKVGSYERDLAKRLQIIQSAACLENQMEDL